MARRIKWEWELLPIDSAGDVIDPQHADTLDELARYDWREMYPEAKYAIVGVYPWVLQMSGGDVVDAHKEESVFLGPQGWMESGDAWIMPADPNPELPKHITAQVTPERLAEIFT